MKSNYFYKIHNRLAWIISKGIQEESTNSPFDSPTPGSILFLILKLNANTNNINLILRVRKNCFYHDQILTCVTAQN